jgi:REP element-mobilizing transposase RayT
MSSERKRMRLQGFDYRHGWFFVTACVQGRRRLFGRVIDGTMVLSRPGQIAEEEWVHTAAVRKDVELDAFVFMPDHFHAIIRVEAPSTTTPSRGPVARSLGAIIKLYKSCSARRIHSETGLSGRDVWQRGFHEWVIRGPRHLRACRIYIERNPNRWRDKWADQRSAPASGFIQ